jgi:multimeric flavodoxin WrbA
VDEDVRVKHLLVVYHSRSGGTRAMAEAVLAGATDPAVEGVEVRARSPFEADVADVAWADGVILGTPAHFGYMSGALKDFFERVYESLLDRTRGLPWALFVKGRSDVDGAVSSVQRIVTGLAWREVQPPVTVVGEVTDADLDRCVELGGAMAAGLALDVF